jgi:uncharacterized protein (UPF0261 family)
MLAIIGTLDTKGDKIAYLKRIIESKGTETLVIDCGILGQPIFKADVSREEVAEAAEIGLNDLRSGRSEEGKAIRIMAEGASKIVEELFATGKMDGLLGIGGTMGTSLFLTVSSILPMGLPKVLVSTTAFSPYLRRELVPSDLIVVPLVSDIWGLDVLTERALDNAGAIMLGLSQVYRERASLNGRTFVGVTTLGTSALKYIVGLKQILEKRGEEVLGFHVGGGQGWPFEQLVRQGLIKGALDLCMFDLCPDSVAKDGFFLAPKRLEAASERGIPQIIAPGDVCELCWPKPIDELPGRYRERKKRQHNSLVWTVERSLEEVAETADLIATKLNKGRGPRAVVIPKRGFATWDQPGEAYYNPERSRVFSQSLKAKLSAEVSLVELEVHINDLKFAEEVAKLYFLLASAAPEAIN